MNIYFVLIIRWSQGLDTSREDNPTTLNLHQKNTSKHRQQGGGERERERGGGERDIHVEEKERGRKFLLIFCINMYMYMMMM